MLKAAFRRLPIYPQIRRYRMRRDFWRPEASERRRRSLYQDLILPGDLVFDVGANMGNRSRVFLRLGARTVAYEPHAECAGYLKEVLSDHGNFSLRRVALGRHVGIAELRTCRKTVLSTLSPDFISAVRKSGRFGKLEWRGGQRVRVSTLDGEIARFGVPAFIKIDVEGFERQVLGGLSRPVACVSVEFTAEIIDEAVACIAHLSAMGPCRVQLSRGESMQYEFSGWRAPDQAVSALHRLCKRDRLAWGDVYIRSLVAKRSNPGNGIR
ncbi:MAG: FkbM family methyltransferase [Gammaproteobacteria bacterium]|jgi:FkbM family methyltransferase|nr:FkbM family methyltransferase [Gammaproteobacteria bacterium]